MMGHVPQNQAVITVDSAIPVPLDGEHQPIDAYLLKPGTATRPDPGARGTVTNSAPAKANKREPWFAAGQWAGDRRPPCSSLAPCGPESLPLPTWFTLGERKWL
jgi:hypothetical protein